MKFVSWNVNGLRACMNKGFLDSFYALDADFFCLQETKLQEGQIELDLPGYQQFWCYAEKKGYSGTAIFTKHNPLSVSYGLGIAELDTEGRLITLEYPEFYLVTCYTPNAQRGLARIEHRMKWEEAFRSYLQELDTKKPVILCGDLNVAHKEIDLKNPSSNRGNAGFSDEERSAFSKLLESGFTDSFRHLYPDVTGAYSWWSYMFNARANNAGWRIDYFVVSNRLKDAIHNATIHPDVMGSDHCPVGLDLNTTCNGSIWSPETQRPEENEKKETDRDTPAGPFWMVAISIVLVIALLLPVQTLLKQEPNDTNSPSTDSPFTDTTAMTAPIEADLIAQVIDRSPSARWNFEPGEPFDPTSSQIPEHAATLSITDGAEHWLLTDISPIFPDDQGSSILGADHFNYYVQVIFTEDKTYSIWDKPEVYVSIATSEKSIDVLAFYENETGNIAGFFIYGYSPSFLELDITALYHGMTETIDVPVIIPAGTFDNTTTKELVNTIQSSGVILDASMTPDDHIFDTLIHNNPYIRELLRREDSIRILIDQFRHDHGTYPGNVTSLLFLDSFQGIMTEEEKAELQSIIDSIDTPTYG